MEKHILNVPPNIVGRDYVVGDIHGCYSLLLKMLADVCFSKEKDRLFCLGDLVDRGPHSESVAELLNEPWFYSILGNHERFCIEAHSPLVTPEVRDIMKQSHKTHGGQWFYKLTEERQKELANMFDELPVMINLQVNGKHIGLAHGDIRDWDTTSYLVKTAVDAVNSSTINSIIWGRTRLSQKNKMPSKGIDHVFLGHTVVNDITVLGNVHYIDTGAVFGGKLSLICLNDYIGIK